MSLVVFGLKVGDPEGIERWAAEGHLPTIASLMARGCHGRLANPTRICEHGTATTLFSGWPADRHGYYYFRQLVPGTYRLQGHGAEDSDASPFWARPGVFDGTVAIIDVPETRPYPGLPGHQLANWSYSQADVHVAPRASEPPDLLEDVRRRFGVPRDLLKGALDGSPAEDRRALPEFLASVRRKGEVCRHVLSLGEPDLTVAFFDETHTATHRFWSYRPEAAGGGSEDETLRHAIREVYRAVDREMGLMLEQLAPNADVVLLSLFGMQDQYPTEGLNSILCRFLGYEAARSSNGGRARPLDIARRVLPEPLRAAISRHLPGRRQEALLADRFTHGTDWERTTAFALPSLYTGFIRVNLRGREPAGIVDPEHYDEVLDRLESDLRQLTDVRTGEPVVDTVTRSSDVFGSGPPLLLPDLFVEWRAGTELLERVRHPRGELVQRRPAFCPGSEETSIGFFAACGPRVGGRGPVGDLAPIDVAPTLLTLLGLKRPGDIRGRPHPGIVEGP